MIRSSMLPRRTTFFVAAASLVTLSSALGAQRPRPVQPNDTRPSIPVAGAAMASFDSAAFAGVHWRELGPFRGGRSVAVAGNPSRPNEFWLGTTGGGVYKSINSGESWAPVTDKYFGGTIGAIAVAPSAPDVVYVGGGEYPLRGNVSHGDGVWKTIDGGKTWAYMGLRETRQIGNVVVCSFHPPCWNGHGNRGHRVGPRSAWGAVFGRQRGQNGSFRAYFDHQAIRIHELRGTHLYRTFEIEDDAGFAGNHFGHANLFDPFVVHWYRLHAGMACGRRVQTVQVEIDARWIFDLVGGELVIAGGFDGDASDVAERPEADSMDASRTRTLRVGLGNQNSRGRKDGQEVAGEHENET